MKELLKSRIARAYQVHKSIRKVSKILGLSYGTIHSVLKERKALLPWSGFERVSRWKGGRRGFVTRWIQKHPNVVIPTSVNQIVELTGCKEAEARSWKIARWAKMKRIAKKLVPKKLILNFSFDKLLINLVDKTSLGFEELSSLEEKKRLKEIS